MNGRFIAGIVVVVLGMCGACSRKRPAVSGPKDATTPEPITAQPVEPPKPAPIKLGEPPRLKEEPR